MLQPENNFTFENCPSQSEDMFEKTACFATGDYKESPILSIVIPMEQKRKVSFDLSPGKSRPGSKQSSLAIRSRISTSSKSEIPIEELESGSLSPTRYNLSNLSKSAFNEKSRPVANSYNMNIQAPESHRFTFSKDSGRDFRMELKSQLEERGCQLPNFTFSPKKIEQPILKQVRAPRSESCIERKSLVPSRENSRDGARERRISRAISPNGKNSVNLGRLNRIKVLSPLPIQNSNCFSPPLSRQGEPKSILDLTSFNLNTETKPQVLNLKLHPILRKAARKSSMQENSILIDEQSISPKFDRKRPSLYKLEETSSPTHIKEMRFKLPSIIQARKSDSNPIRAGVGSYRPDINDKWNYYKFPKGPENLLKLNISGRPSTDESSNLHNKYEPHSAGLDSQRGSSRFKAEEMILNKLFKPIMN